MLTKNVDEKCRQREKHEYPLFVLLPRPLLPHFWRIVFLRMTFGISAIVTGAASGLGRATAAKLASRGAGVVIFDLPNSDGAAVASELGGKVLFCPGDVTNPQDAQNAAEMAMKEFGSLQGKRFGRSTRTGKSGGPCL